MDRTARRNGSRHSVLEQSHEPRALTLLVPSDSGKEITLAEALRRSTDKTARRPQTARDSHYRRAIAESLDIRPMTSRKTYKPLPPPPLPETFPSSNKVLSNLTEQNAPPQAHIIRDRRSVTRSETLERTSRGADQFRYLVGPTSPYAKPRVQQVGVWARVTV